MAQDGEFWRSLFNTLVYTVGTVPTSMALGLAVALGLNRKLPGRALLRSIFFVPVVISLVAVALIASWIFNDDYGVINNALGALGFGNVPGCPRRVGHAVLDHHDALDPSRVQHGHLPGGPAVHPDGALPRRAGGRGRELEAVPAHHVAASRADDVPALDPQRHLLAARLRPDLRDDRGGPGSSTTVLVQYIYEAAFQNSEMGYASAVGVVLYLMLLVFTVFQWRLHPPGRRTSVRRMSPWLRLFSRGGGGKGAGRWSGMKGKDFVVWMLLVRGAIVMVFPLYWMFVDRRPPEVGALRRRLRPAALPGSPGATSPSAWGKLPWSQFYVNSFAIVIIAVVMTVFINLLAGYTFAKYEFWGRNVLFLLLISTLMIPIQVIMVPEFLIVSRLGLGGHLLGGA